MSRSSRSSGSEADRVAGVATEEAEDAQAGFGGRVAEAAKGLFKGLTVGIGEKIGRSTAVFDGDLFEFLDGDGQLFVTGDFSEENAADFGAAAGDGGESTHDFLKNAVHHIQAEVNADRLAGNLPEIAAWSRGGGAHLRCAKFYRSLAVSCNSSVRRMSGTLYIVATPIGNLEDLTFRAVRVLREVDVIACEDTRQTRKLLDHYGIQTAAVSYHEHNEQARAEQLVGELEQGRNVAVVSDAGTPLIADPGYRIVEKARRLGIAVVPIPGPSAMLAGLSASGLPTDAFAFLGFLPAKSGQRRKALEEARGLGMTVIFYETPHRIVEALEDIAAVLGNAPVVLGRELTKVHEEFLSGSAAELHAELKGRAAVKGEFTVVIGKSEPVVEAAVPMEEEVAQLMAGGMGRMDALKQVARRRGLSKREVYKRVGERR